jgi:hypothetical protein
MSNVSVQIYEKEGGAKMIGRNVFEHHQEPAKSQMMDVVNQKRHVIYTTEKGGVKKTCLHRPLVSRWRIFRFRAHCTGSARQNTEHRKGLSVSPPSFLDSHSRRKHHF